jgi:DNA-binding GntR family transcriptional regulator
MRTALSTRLARSAPVAIAEGLRAQILSGALAAGTQIRQDAVAAEYGVSHIPVREALRRLEAEGLVTIHANRGAFVSRLDAADARDIGDMRASLEALAARLAVPQAGPGDLAAAEAAIAASDQSLATSDQSLATSDQSLATSDQSLATSDQSRDVARWSEANWAFHRALYAPCARPRLLAAIEVQWRNVDRYLRVVWQAADYQARSQHEHRAILAAFRAREAERAAALVAAHIDDAMRVLAEFLANA